jgi:RNA polymerase sigma-70 factor, ECF subfamily
MEWGSFTARDVSAKLAHRPGSAMHEPIDRWSSFERLVRDNHVELRHFAFRFLGNLSDVDDVLQDAYLKAFRAYGRFSDTGRGSGRAWLFRIVHRCCLDELRRRRRRSMLSGLLTGRPGEQAGPEVAVVARIQLAAALAQLTDEARAAVLLVDGAGVEYAAVARILDIAEGTVASRLSAARAALRAMLDETEQGR